MQDATFHFNAGSEADTERLGKALAEALPGGCAVALVGPLGAGKTRLVQALAAAAGVDRRDVVSPTFVLLHEYQGAVPIYHFDAYRLRDDDEFLQLGADEYFAGRGWVLVEWADRVARCLPAEYLSIVIHLGSGTARTFEITARGIALRAALERLAAALTS
jgi:tRNA threonylcarbamoyladenosine biosynthesis protein TsaE